MKVSAIILAGGSGTRFGKENKLLFEAEGFPVIRHTLKKFEGLVDEIVLVVNTALQNEFEEAAKGIAVKIVAGGETRTESARNGLAAVSGDIVLIHDGARPFVSCELISRCIADVKEYGSSVSAVKSTDTFAQAAGDKIISVPQRAQFYRLQTPQGFLTADILKAYSRAQGEYTDDSGVYMSVGLPHLTEGEYGNTKITTKEDLAHFAAPAPDSRIGNSFDVHRLVEGRKLILGGVHIPYEKGLLGHSDADVILHTLMGAVLNAMGLKDIGTYFPDTDPAYKGANSADLLTAVLILMKSSGYAIRNASLTVIAERPKLAPHIDSIKQSLSRLLSLPPEDIGLGATTAERLGEIGTGDSIACTGYVLLKKN